MALTLTAAFTREVSRADSRPVVLVNIGGLTNGKFVLASRRVLGYTNNVLKVPSRSSGINPLTCKQTLSTMTIDFEDDGLVKALIVANKLIGKTCTVKLGFDTGDDATFLETDYAGYSAGVIDTWESVPGIVRLVLKDPRSVFFHRDGAPIKVPSFLDVVFPGQDPIFRFEGPASDCMRELLISANLATTHYTDASYEPSASTQSGHLQIYRNFGRVLKKPTDVQVLMDQIGSVLRGYNLVLEDGLIAWKEFDAAASSTFRFTEADIVPGSVKCRQDDGKIISSFSCQTIWTEEGGFGMTFRDTDATGESDWSYTGGTTKPADFAISDEWFTSTAGIYQGAQVAAGATSFKVVSASFAGAQSATGKTSAEQPNAVDASHPGYVFIRGVTLGGQSPNPGEIIKYTTITRDTPGDTYILGGLTRGMFGTSDILHATTTNGPGPFVADVTALIRCGTEVIKRFREGATALEFDTPLHTYSVQLADVGYVETDVFVRFGLDGLAVGNTTPFEVVQKEVDLDKGTISWRLVEIRTASHTPTWGGGVVPGAADFDPFPGVGGATLGGIPVGTIALFNPGETALGGLTFSYLGGEVAATSANLTHTIPYQRAATRAGVVTLPDQAHTYTASKDTYLDLEPYPGKGASRWRFTEVANGAAAPAIGTGELRAFKVVTSGAAITSVTDLRSAELVDAPNVVPNSLTGSQISTALQLEGTLDVPHGVSMASPSQDGIPLSLVFDRAATNHCKNPSFEVNVTDFWEDFGTVTTSRDTSVFLWGAASAKVEVTAVNEGLQTELGTAPAAVVTDFWLCSANVRVSSGTRIIVVETSFYDAADALVNGTTKSYTISSGSWFKLWVGSTAAATTAKVRFKVYSNSAASFDINIDGVMMVKNGPVWPETYFDGSLPSPGMTWQGTAHNSASDRTGGLHILGAIDTASGRPIYVEDSGTFVTEFLTRVGTEKAYLLLAGDGGSSPTGMCVIDGTSVEFANCDLKLRPKGLGVLRVGGGSLFHVNKDASNQNVGTGTTLVTWVTTDGEFFDYNNDFDNTNDRFTCPEDGIYEFWASLFMIAVPDQQSVRAWFGKNGSTSMAYVQYDVASSVGGGGNTTPVLTGTSGPVKLVAGDTVAVYMSTTGATRTLSGSEAETWFKGKRIA